GLPRKRITVATFTAPARKAPGIPGTIKLGAKPGAAHDAAAKPRALTITWGAAKNVARYGVRVALPDGRKLFFLRDADDRVVRITDAPADGRVVVRVVGLRADNSHGPAATANSSLAGGNR